MPPRSSILLAMFLVGCAGARSRHSLPAPSIGGVDDPTPRAAKQASPGVMPAAAVPRASDGSDWTTGKASYYADRFHGRLTASGERFDMYAHTAAHRTLPFGTRILVTHVLSGRSTIVRITDRGPFVGGRIIDLSRAAAVDLGMLEEGVAPVRLEIVPDHFATGGT